jgi:hypothetical protein
MWDSGMWFGTRDYAQFIPMPKVDSDMSKFGWNNRIDFLNGGTSIARSKTSHKEYNFGWPLQGRDKLRIVSDFADGIYGDGPFYFIDPFAADKNILPQYWAVPMLGGYDGPLLAGTTNPTLTTTTSNTNKYPVKSATYTLAGTTNKELYIPIPTGYSLYLGAHGTATGTAAVTIKPVVSGTTYGTTSNLTLLLETSTTRVNATVSGASYTGAIISLTGTGTITLSGLIGQILPTGTTAATGSFISGQGNSGCEFEIQPTLQNYSVGMDLVGMSAKLVEVGAWL